MSSPRFSLFLLALLAVAAPAHAATLSHRYEFNGNLRDSVANADGTGTVAGKSSAAVTYDASRPPGASGPVASVQIGQVPGKFSGFSLPDDLLKSSGSLAFWVKADRADAGPGADYVVNTGGTYNKDLRVAIAAERSRLEANVANTNTSLALLAPGVWYHIVITWDAEAKAADLYVNGLMVKSQRWEDPDRFALPALRVGNWAFSEKYLDNQFTGALYDLQIYTGRLEASEVKRLHAAPGGTLASARR